MKIIPPSVSQTAATTTTTTTTTMSYVSYVQRTCDVADSITKSAVAGRHFPQQRVDF